LTRVNFDLNDIYMPAQVNGGQEPSDNQEIQPLSSISHGEIHLSKKLPKAVIKTHSSPSSKKGILLKWHDPAPQTNSPAKIASGLSERQKLDDNSFVGSESYDSSDDDYSQRKSDM
jgi:hypothetical protein